MKKIDTQLCNCEECSSSKENQKDYFVTQEQITDKKYKNGLSGVLRVKDEEFLDLAIKTSVDALDELIVVVQKTDNDPYKSFEVAKKFESLYPKKIKVYLYEPSLDSYTYYERNQNSVNKQDVIKREFSVHGAANYINFAFSKVSYKYSIKIDADQYYFTDKLDFIRNFYKKNIIGIIKHYIKNIIFIKTLKNLLFLHKNLINNKNKFPMFFGINLYKFNKDIITAKTLLNHTINNSNTLNSGTLATFNGGWDYFIEKTKNRLFDLHYDTLYEKSLLSNWENLYSLGTLFFHLQGVKNNFAQRHNLIGSNIIETINNNKNKILNVKELVELTSYDILENNDIPENKTEKTLPYFNKIPLATLSWENEKNCRKKYLKQMLNDLKTKIDIEI